MGGRLGYEKGGGVFETKESYIWFKHFERWSLSELYIVDDEHHWSRNNAALCKIWKTGRSHSCWVRKKKPASDLIDAKKPFFSYQRVLISDNKKSGF